MATIDPSRRAARPAPSSPKPAGGRDAGASATGKGSGAKASGAKGSPGPGKNAAPPEPSVFEGFGTTIVAVALLILAVVAGFGVYAASAGPLGRGSSAALGWLVGVLRYVAPVAFAGAGVVCAMWGRARFGVEAEEPGDRAVTIRRSVGGALCFLSAAGLLHIALADDARQGLSVVTDAGGLIGAALGAPLAALVTGAGAAAVFVLVTILGVSLASGRSLASLATSVRSGARPAMAAIARWLGDLFRVGGDRDAEGVEPTVELFDHQAKGQGLPGSRPTRVAGPTPAGPPPEPTVFQPSAVEPTQLAMDLGPGYDGDWKLPPMNLLTHTGSQSIDTDAITARGRQLEATLAEHGVHTRLSGMVVGPTVTRYELELGVGVKVNSVISLQKDIAYSMATPEVRIEAPIRGKQAIGVEVPNHTRQIVAVADILSSSEAKAARHPLEVAVGRDIEGRNIMVNLAKMPHVLIAGQTGAGKSSCINSIMASILMRATPDQVRLILVDPKRVELTQYNRIPHLLTQVVTNPKKAANAMSWAVKEMERRYELLEAVGFRDITGYNAAFDRGELVPEPGEAIEYPRLPFILIIVDELADLMMVAARDVEESINRIAAKARAVGVHLVIATQRPSVDVITGVIKANIPARFAFAVATATDSKVILGNGGAEKLIGQGDMLLLGPTSSVPDRIQGCWVEEAEVAKVVSHWRRQVKEVQYVEEVQGEDTSAAGSAGHGFDAGDDDDLLIAAMELIVRSNFGSTSMLQRKLKVGFARAGRLMDLLEQRGVVGPSTGSKAREVLMTVPELDLAMGRTPAEGDDDGSDDFGPPAEAVGTLEVSGDRVDVPGGDVELRHSRANDPARAHASGFGVPLDD